MKKSLFILFLALISTSLLEAKSKSNVPVNVHGLVISQLNDEVVVGAIIKEKKGDGGFTTTDIDGQFVLSVPEGTELLVECVGYASKTVKAKPQMIINLTPSDYADKHWFISAIAGPLIAYEESYYWDSYGSDGYVAESQAEFGIMFGMMWHNWGWYVKPSLPVVFKNYPYKAQYGFSLGLGALRRLAKDLNIYAGSGIGCGFWTGYDYNQYGEYYRYESNFGDMFAVLFELGFQYNIKHFNLEVGLQYAMGTNEPEYQRNFKPYFGLGYNF